MKKLILLLIIVTSSFITQAQEGYHFGITTGFYTTWIVDKTLSDDPSYDYPKFSKNKWRSSPIGIELGHNFSDNSGIQIEAIIAKQGQVWDIVDKNKEKVGKKEIELTYISLPLLFKAIGGENNFKFAFKLGPQISFLRKGTDIEIFDKTLGIWNFRGETDSLWKAAGMIDEYSPIIYKDKKYYWASTESSDSALYKFNGLDLSIVFDLGMEVEIVSGLYISALVRFSYGFFDIKDADYIDNIENVLTYSPSNNTKGGFQFGIHYIIKK